MTTAMALLISIFGMTPADGVGGSGHGAVFDGATPAYTWPEYEVG